MILCCGEALMDMLPRTVGTEGTAFLPVPGGAIFNTALALGRLGNRAGFLCGVSTDLFGEQLLAHLAASGVTSDLCIRSARPTTLAFVRLVNGDATYTFYDENSAGRLITPEDLPVLPDGTGALHFGAISLIGEPCGTAYEALLTREAPARVISLDPNIRPGFITDEAAYRARLSRIIPLADIIKVSHEDLDWLAPGEPFEALAQGWIASGAKIVILTLGKDGARALTRTLDVTVPARKVEVVDTVGAGDTFNAGFLSALEDAGLLTKEAVAGISDQSLTAALARAVAVAAITVSRAGANPPFRSELSGI